VEAGNDGAVHCHPFPNFLLYPAKQKTSDSQSNREKKEEEEAGLQRGDMSCNSVYLKL